MEVFGVNAKKETVENVIVKYVNELFKFSKGLPYGKRNKYVDIAVNPINGWDFNKVVMVELDDEVRTYPKSIIDTSNFLREQLSGKFTISVDNTGASFTLARMPGCCGVCISTGAEVNEDLRGRGVGTLLNNFRIELARALGYGQIVCTVTDDNEVQMRILARNKWTLVSEFENPRSGNIVGSWIINL